jgi:predicted nuclease of predicted toxin-antitoxin system
MAPPLRHREMKFLADVNVSITTAQALREQGYDVLHLREEGLHQLSDGEVLARARDEDRVLLTLDQDFGGLLAAGVHPLPNVILFRLRDQTPASLNARLLALLAEREADLAAGALVVVEDARYRLRRLPIAPLE